MTAGSSCEEPAVCVVVITRVVWIRQDWVYQDWVYRVIDQKVCLLGLIAGCPFDSDVWDVSVDSSAVVHVVFFVVFCCGVVVFLLVVCCGGVGWVFRHAGGCVFFCGFWGCCVGVGLRCGVVWCMFFICCR